MDNDTERVKYAIDNTIAELESLKDDLEYETRASAIKFELRTYLVYLIEEITGKEFLGDPVLDSIGELNDVICNSARYTGYGERGEHDRHPTSDKREGKLIIKKIGKLLKKK